MEELNFEIQIGGENVITENQDNNPIIPSESMKNWELCKHRSEKMVYWMRSSCNCGPGSNVEMHRCLKLDISNLNPSICASCLNFEAKDQV